MLSALVDDLPTQAARIEALRQPPAAREPLYLWLAAHHRAASGGLLSGACPSRRTGSNFAGTCAENPQALALAEAARDAIASRKAGKVAFYAWSIRRHELEAMNFELLCRLHLAAGDAAAALAAIEQACDLAASTTRGGLRGSILCEFYPDRREEAFDDAFRYGEFGGYDAIMAHPDYADYVARRKNRKKRKSDKGWRWGEQKKPASEADLRQAEAQLGTALPPDYRAFLAKTGRSELMIRLAEESADLRFHGAGELMQQRGYLIDFITRTQRSSAEAESYFGQQYGVSLRDLVPIAEPSNLSRCILIHLGAGERFGWCYRWDHDGAWELEAAQPSFEAALRALTAGIERRDENALSFFEISPDREE
jgi:hypothetical protein